MKMFRRLTVFIFGLVLCLGMNILPVEAAKADQIVGEIEELNDDSFEEEGVELYAENHSPGKRDTSLVWDKNIFYTLEGYQSDTAYVNKYSCTLERKSILTADGDTLSCDVYLNPDNGLPNKIVVIDYLDDGIEVTEIYYTNEGKPNFTFRYTTDNYVATYATPDKDGVRCQFKKDVLVNWRIIEGKNTHNYVIGQNMVDFLSSSWAADTIYMLDEQSTDLQDEFDNIEIKMLNYAYNIYDAVMNESGVERARITGRVVDEKGKPCKGVKVNLYDEHMKNKYYTVKTDANGIYIIYIPYTKYVYSIEVNKKIDGKKCKSRIHRIEMDGKRNTIDQDDISLTPKDDEISVSLSLQCEDSDGESAKVDFSTGKVNVREGHDNYDGDIFMTADSDAKGKVSLKLPAGDYTLEIIVDDCQTIFKNITIGEDKEKISCIVLPKVQKQHYSIIATWDGDLDPDIHWFDLDDDQEISDHTKSGSSGYCITDLDISASDYYKYCVLDVINAAAEKKNAKDMSSSGLTIYIYGPDGLEYVFVVPVDEEGILWEVFEIRNGKIQPIQRYYDTLEDADWWNKEKDVKHPELLEYAELLSNGSNNGEMSVFDLNKDGIYEVALRDASVSEKLPDGVGILSYDESTGMIITPLDSIEYVAYIDEQTGRFMTDRIQGKVIYSFNQLENDGSITNSGSYCIPYLKELSNGYTAEDVDSYNQEIQGMAAPKWVSITEDNIKKYLSGDGKSTGITKETPETITVTVQEPEPEPEKSESDVYAYINGDWEINGGGASDNGALYYSIDNGVIQLINRNTGEVKENKIEYAAFNDSRTQIVIAYYAQFNEYNQGYRRFVFDISGGNPTEGWIGDYNGSNVAGDLFSEDGNLWYYSGGSSIHREGSATDF